MHNWVFEELYAKVSLYSIFELPDFGDSVVFIVDTTFGVRFIVLVSLKKWGSTTKRIFRYTRLRTLFVFMFLTTEKISFRHRIEIRRCS
jgi:hypothetical protein